jgi:hypothetical protein
MNFVAYGYNPVERRPIGLDYKQEEIYNGKPEVHRNNRG